MSSKKMSIREITKFLEKTRIGGVINIYCKETSYKGLSVLIKTRRGRSSQLVEVELSDGYILYREPRNSQRWQLKTTGESAIVVETEGAKVDRVERSPLNQRCKRLAKR